MSDSSKTIAEIHKLSQQKFPDVPWSNQSLTIKIDDSIVSKKFQIIFDGDYSELEFDFVPKGQFGTAPAHVDEVSVEYSIPEGSDSALLVLKNKSAQDFIEMKVSCRSKNFHPRDLVCLQHDDTQNQWVVIYNSLDRQNDFIAGIKKILQSSKDPARENLYAFFQLLVKRNFNAALHAVESSKQLSGMKTQLQWATALYGYQLNAHGLKRTFKFWTSEEKQAYLQSGAQMIASLKSISPFVCLGFGAVLGFHRDSDLIAHDDDIDIVIAFNKSTTETLGLALEIVERQLLKSGFEIAGRFFGHLWVRTEAGLMVDVFVGLIEDQEKMAFYPSSRHTLQKSDVFPTVAGQLYSVELPVPANIDAYLAKTYGEKWREPDIGFSHAWNRDEYLDIAGVRKHPVMQTRGEIAFRERNAAKK